jgi:O-antigen/teichoic acid export membrane protein
MVLTVGVGLVVTRLLVRLLGQADFGLLGLLGATGGFLAVVTYALSGSSQRHIAYEIGRGDRERLAIVFNTSLGVFAVLALGVWAVGAACAPLVVRGLKIPPEREWAAFWVFHFTVASLAISVLMTPFRGLFSAHQELVISAIFDALEVFTRLAATLILLVWPNDRLAGYAALLFIGNTIAQGSAMLLCLWRYPESRPRPSRFKWAELRPLGLLAGWAILGSLVYQVAMQSSDILLNLYFGATAIGLSLNAAFLLAMNVSSYQGNLGNAINRAVSPALVGVEARGDRANVRLLTLLSAKWTALATLFYLVPMQYEIDYVLALWLGPEHVPPYTATFVRLVTVWMAVQFFGNGFNMAIMAVGEVGRYTIGMCVLMLATLAVALGVLHAGGAPWTLPATLIWGTVVTVLFQAWFVGRRIDLPIGEWLRRSVLPVLIVAAAGVAAGLVGRPLSEGPVRLAVTLLASGIAIAAASWFFAMEPAERGHLGRLGRAAMQRLSPRRPSASSGGST